MTIHPEDDTPTSPPGEPQSHPELDTPVGMPYPVQIYEDRYGGSYSGGIWLAACGFKSLQTSPTQAGDVEAMNFFEGDPPDPRAKRIGRGNSPDLALNDLVARWVAAGRGWDFEWDELIR